MLKGPLDDVNNLDIVLKAFLKASKDSTTIPGLEVGTKTYELNTTNPHKARTTIRIWFDRRTKEGTIKINRVPYCSLGFMLSLGLINIGLLTLV